ncbi:MAG: hypothetical protein EXS25_06745 [Pedosphaera sp.]|nr:hypothetical protein [Pedosphaera sp.]
MTWLPFKSLAVGVFLGLLTAPINRAAETNNTAQPAPSSFASFIAERNIFNPDRRAHILGEVRRPVERPRSTVQPTLTLVGTIDYPKGRFAFFDGPTDTYRKTLKTNALIAGYTLLAIEPNRVRLQATNGPIISLEIGNSLRLENAEPVDASVLSATVTSEKTEATSSTGGDASDILKKLMQKREQESK